jgi:hypothetical protein
MADVTTTPTPRTERGAADSMRIAATLIYVLDISGGSASRICARIRKRRKQIMAVTMMFTPTLSEIHGTTVLSLPLRRYEGGRPTSTTVKIERTAKKSTTPTVSHPSFTTESVYRRTRGSEIHHYWEHDNIPSGAPD